MVDFLSIFYIYWIIPFILMLKMQCLFLLLFILFYHYALHYIFIKYFTLKVYIIALQ